MEVCQTAFQWAAATDQQKLIQADAVVQRQPAWPLGCPVQALNRIAKAAQEPPAALRFQEVAATEKAPWQVAKGPAALSCSRCCLRPCCAASSLRLEARRYLAALFLRRHRL